MARNWIHRSLRLLAFPLIVGCSGAAPKPAAKAAPPAASAPKAEQPDARRRLLAALRALERPGPVLDALPPDANKTITLQLGGLSPEQRGEIQSGAGGLAEMLPLLHIAAGGESPQALFALAVTPRAAESLPASVGAATKLAVVAEVARRAGLHFLRDRTLDLAVAPSTTAALCRAIDQVGSAMGRRDIVRKTRELWVTLEPTRAVWLKLARSRALDLDIEGARAALDQAKGAAGLEQVARVIDAAALVKSGSNSPALEAALPRARAELTLERWPEALSTLTPFRAEADRHLGVAAALAIAETKGSACPGLAPGVGSQGICALAWSGDAAVKQALERLERAFASKLGRDAEALETYLGLVHIIPWIHLSSTTGGVDPESAARAAAPSLEALRGALAEASHLSHVRVFVDALALGFKAALERKPGDPPRIPKAERDKLRAAALAERSAVARLAAASVLSAEEDVSALVMTSSSTDLSREQRAARAGLLTWLGSSPAHPEAIEPARAALAELVAEFQDDDLARAETVLLLAEFDALRDPSERSANVLAKVATELISGAIPPELGLRAVLDAAGSLVAIGRKEDARKILEQAQSVAPLPGPSLEILVLIRGYLTVLKAETGPAADIPALKRELSTMVGSEAPPSIALAFARWLKRLEALEAEARCLKAKGANCAAQAKKLRQVPREIAARLHPDTVDLFQKAGFLRTTRAGLRLSYAPETGIVPEVSFSPSFLKLD